MKKLILLLTILFFSQLYSIEYQINLTWDEFEGECNGFMSGSIGKEHAFVGGGGAQEVLNGKLISVGEGMSMDSKQVFKVKSNEGYFTFWIKDKFADDDMNNDPTLIARSKPMISIYKGKNLVDLIKIPDGAGLTCKVFTLDAATGEVDREIKFYPKSRIIVGKVVNAVTGEPLADAGISIEDYMQDTRIDKTDETGIFIKE